MKYRVINYGTWPGREEDIIYLQKDSWDDFSFCTTFQAFYLGEKLGYIKIGYKGMQKGEYTYTILPSSFQQLDESFFSLWQSEKNYHAVSLVNQSQKDNVFLQLNDVAYNLSLLNRFADERCMQESLLRDITLFTCREQFHRISVGGSVLTDYHFNICMNSGTESTKFSFDVLPYSKPSSNIHVLIGRNGIGKTRLIRDVICDICGGESGRATMKYTNQTSDDSFANVLCVSFSPFDDYSDVINLVENPQGNFPKCSYIGLDRNKADLLNTIQEQFIFDLKGCFSSSEKTERWRKSMDILESDPMFKALNIGCLVENKYLNKNGKEEHGALEKAEALFSLLSSGHKCVLSIITSCVNKLEEKSILFVDEPENHLHPPLLASLIQALSFLLNDRNGVAIISTHSPVVLQEVPKSRVWILNRSGEEWSGKRPDFETYGSDIGSLTREIFGLEVLMSGYHRMIKQAVDEADSLYAVLNAFDNNLGSEALGLAHVLWTLRETEGDRDD